MQNRTRLIAQVHGYPVTVKNTRHTTCKGPAMLKPSMSRLAGNRGKYICDIKCKKFLKFLERKVI